MKIAAYQAPFLPNGSAAAPGLIRERINWCESEGVKTLCCPEAIIGGLADYADNPDEIAIDTTNGELEKVLTPIRSAAVTTIVGFTERAGAGKLYNSAAVIHRGSIMGVYRKQKPAINRSIYNAGDRSSIFTVDCLKFGILICNDSNFPELAKDLASQGAKAIFIPSNNALPLEKADVVAATNNVDIGMARENNVWVIRADVVGRANGRISYGSSVIVNPDGVLVCVARRLSEDLIVQDI